MRFLGKNNIFWNKTCSGGILLSLVLFPFISQAAQITPQEIIEKVNNARASYALAPLRENHLLTLAAYAKARDMETAGYFGHYAPHGAAFYDWIEDEGYHFTYAGENLAKDFTDTDTLMKAWMASPSHRANILDRDFCEIGIATMVDQNGSPLVVEMFGCRRDSFVTTSTAPEDNKYSSWQYAIAPADSTIRLSLPNTGESGQEVLTWKQEKRDNNRQSLSILALAAVMFLSIGERYRHYHHTYKIPISVIPKKRK